MEDDEEQPIAIAFTSRRIGDGILEELVYDGDIFWGTIYRNFIEECPTPDRIIGSGFVYNCVAFHFPRAPAAAQRMLRQTLRQHYYSTHMLTLRNNRRIERLVASLFFHTSHDTRQKICQMLHLHY